jgi:hypothetical protein
MTSDMEKIIAYVDGELKPDERQALETEAAQNPHLQAQIDAHRALNVRLSAAFAPIIDEPVPAGLAALLRAEPEAKAQANVVPFRPRDLKRYLPQSAAQWGAMAASLIAGIGLTLALGHTPAGDMTTKNSELIAQGRLERALSTQLAADETPADAPHIGLTFRAASGTVCRTFTTGAAEGLACRDEDRWRIDVLSRSEAHSTYVQAGSPLITQAVGARIEGDAFDSAAEKAAKSDGWKPVRTRQ